MQPRLNAPPAEGANQSSFSLFRSPARTAATASHLTPLSPLEKTPQQRSASLNARLRRDDDAEAGGQGQHATAVGRREMHLVLRSTDVIERHHRAASEQPRLMPNSLQRPQALSAGGHAAAPQQILNTAVKPLRRRTNAPLSSTMPQLFVSAGMPAHEQKWQLSKWASDYDRGVTDGAVSETVACEAMMKQVRQASAHLPSPNLLRVATSTLLLDRVCGARREGNLLRELVDELTEAVYMPPATRGAPTALYTAAQLEAIGLDPMGTINDVLTRKPFFELYEEVAAREADAQAALERIAYAARRQGRVLDRCVSAWQVLTRRCVFMAWRGVVVREKQQTDAVSNFVRRYERRDVLQTHLVAWRVATIGAISQRQRAQLSVGVDQVAHREAVAHNRVEELEDQLTELSFVASRLREEKLAFGADEAKMVKALDNTLYKAEQWRTVAVHGLDFYGGMRHSLVEVKSISGGGFQHAADLATRVVLDWVAGHVRRVPQGAKVRLASFGHDMRDGAVYVMLLHSITKDHPASTVSLDNLGHRDIRRRMDVVLDAVQSFNIYTSCTASELVAGSAEVHFLLLFSLWWHFATPPVAAAATCAGGERNMTFRDDLAATQDYFTACKAFYPEWLANRAMLLEYALYVMASRARGVAAKMHATDELKQIARDMGAFELTGVSRLPDVFLDFGFMTVHHKALNEDERGAVNRVVEKHLTLLRSVYLFYSKTDGGDGGGKGEKAARKPKHEKYDPMSFVGFYRFCEECRFVAAQTVDEAGPVELDAAETAAAPKDANAMQLNKATCYQIFMECVRKFADDKKKPALLASTEESAVLSSASVAVSPSAATTVAGAKKSVLLAAALTPAGWIAATLRIAVARYGTPLVAGRQVPAAGADSLDTMVCKDIAPFACASQSTPFQQEAWSTRVQDLLQKRRKLLMAFFEHFAGMDGDGTMSMVELLAALNAVDAVAPPVTLGIVRETFHHFTGRSNPDVVVADALGRGKSSVAARRSSSALLADSQAEPPLDGKARKQSMGTSGIASPRTNDGDASPRLVSPRSPVAVSFDMPQSQPLSLQASTMASPRGIERVTSVLSEGATNSSDDEEEEEDDDTALVYGEFELLLVTLAVYVTPSPHAALEAKLRFFLEPLCGKVAAFMKKLQKQSAAELRDSTQFGVS
jgi:hypothetical protein